MFLKQAVIPPTILLTIALSYTKKLTFFTAFTIVMLASVNAQPVSDFSVSKSTGCSPLLVSFTNQSQQAVSYSWNFGNGNTSTLPNPSASFIQAGVYNVKLTVKDASGQTAVSEKQITVVSNPVADFAVDKLKACVNDSILFTDRSVNGSSPITSWSWDFGDGSNSVKQSPDAVKYTFSDQFKITLVVRDNNGCQSSVTRSNYIQVSDIKAGFTSSSSKSCRGPLSVLFEDTTKTGTQLYTYSWDFGDGQNASGKSISHTYTNAGSYGVNLTVSNASGCNRSVLKENLVSILQPKAAFTASNTAGCAPLKVNFLNLSETADSNNTVYQWTSSAAHTSTLKQPEFIFTQPGTYTVKLRMTVNGTCTDSVVRTAYITVHPKASAQISVSASQFCSVPAVVRASASLADGSQVAAWLWGDNTSGSEQEKTYSSYGEFRIRLVVRNSMGCVDTVALAQPVVVKAPQLTAQISKKSGCAPFSSTLKASSAALNQWEWKVNGVKISSSQQVTVNIADTGVHVVSCTGVNADGCSVTVYDTIVAGMKITPDFATSKQQTCYNDSAFLFFNRTPADSAQIADKWIWNFGNGVTAVTKETNHKYAAPGVYEAKLIAVHKGCSTESVPVTLTVNGPKATFSLPVVSCSNDSIVFADLSKGSNKRTWNLGDGTISEEQSLKYKYAVAGKYTVSLTVSDTLSGCTDTMTGALIIPVIEAPVLRYTQSDSAICPGQTVRLTDQSTGPIASTTFTFGNGSTVSNKNAAFSTIIKGYYSVKLTVKTTNGCSYTMSKDSAIRVYGEKVELQISNANGCLPLTVKASDMGTTEFPVVNRIWKWGNGDTSASASNTSEYTYQQLPQDQQKGYTVTLFVTDAKGCTYPASYVVKPTKPAARFNYTVNKGCGQDTVRFASLAKGVAPLTFKWMFASDSSNLLNPQRVFSGNSASTIAVNMIVADTNNCIDSVSQNILVDTRTPLAKFYATPEKILDCPGPPVFFHDSSITGASAIKTWEWMFGDNTRSQMINPAKTYLEPGSYDVKLKITDSLGCVSVLEKKDYIRISGPLASYTITSKAGCMPLGVSFKALSGNTKKFEWDMGDGTIDTNATYKHTYFTPGKFFPSLSITDSNGCKRTLPVSDTVIVHSLPVPELESDKHKICKGSSVTFSNRTRHDKKVSLSQWDFGDGNKSMKPGLMAFDHTYEVAGNFTVRLKVTDELGCSDSIAKPSVVQAFYDSIAPAVPSVIHATVLNNESTQLVFRKNQESDFEKYTLYYRYSASGKADSLVIRSVNDTVFTDFGLNTLENRYFYSVSATDACRNVSAPSPLHATMQLTASPAVNAVQLSWTGYKGWKPAQYEIHRLNTTTAAFEPIATVAGDATVYTDSFPACRKTHYYRIKAVENGAQGSYSWSDTSGALPVFESTIPTTSHVRVTVEDNAHTRLEWKNVTHRYAYQVLLYRGVNNAEPVLYKQLNPGDTVFTDHEVNVHNNAYTYITYLQDACGAMSKPSNPSRTLLLGVELQQTGKPGYNPELNWNEYLHWDSGVEDYEVEFKYDSLDQFTVKTKTSALSFFDKDIDEQQRKYCYQVVARQKGNNAIQSRSNMVCTSTDPKLFAPNAFTPNNDGINETFSVKGVFIESFNLKVWNRYGEQVFESNDMQEGWDATFRGEAAPADGYVYLAEAKGRSGKLVTITGTVTLMR